ncbi:MAG TPA: isochorismatase family protein [Acidimicrobiales bacterium]|nr:isochorismatase family protein [Acidimicrobiales bacterium]
MPLDISDLVDPRRTALLVNEMQTNVVGPEVDGPLAAGGRVVLPAIVLLADAARRSAVPVFQCLKVFRRDGLGRNRNIVLYHRRDAAKGPTVAGAAPPPADSRPVAGTEVLAELGPDERDLVSTRLHGMSSIFDTGVDPLLRTLGVSTVVVTGVSVNIGVTNVTMDLANRGYDVVIPRDAVAGTPDSYTAQAIDHSLRFLATITTTADLLDAWRRHDRP